MRVVDFTAELNLREVDRLLAVDDIEEAVEGAVGRILKDVRRRGDLWAPLLAAEGRVDLARFS